MDGALDHSQSIFGRIIGDPIHRPKCTDVHCHNTVPLQYRIYAAIDLAQLHINTMAITLQAKLAMVAKHMLCDECKTKKLRAKEVARQWIREMERHPAAILPQNEQTCNASAFSMRRTEPSALYTYYWPTSISHAFHVIREQEGRPSGANISCTRHLIGKGSGIETDSGEQL